LTKADKNETIVDEVLPSERSLVITIMTKKFLLCLLFFSLSPLVLGFAIFLVNFTSFEGKVLGEITKESAAVGVILAEVPQTSVALAPTLKVEDSTPVIIEAYLRYYQSPLLPYSNFIVGMAHKYKVKPQLIVAIAQQESNLGKKSPEDCYNAWGWGIHARGTTCFENWPQAIETVTAGIAKSYCSQGFCDDPCEMMKKYTPKSNGSWCAGVNQFLDEMAMGEF
jgi:hypothetical protein